MINKFLLKLKLHNCFRKTSFFLKRNKKIVALSLSGIAAISLISLLVWYFFKKDFFDCDEKASKDSKNNSKLYKDFEKAYQAVRKDLIKEYRDFLVRYNVSDRKADTIIKNIKNIAKDCRYLAKKIKAVDEKFFFENNTMFMYFFYEFLIFSYLNNDQKLETNELKKFIEKFKQELQKKPEEFQQDFEQLQKKLFKKDKISDHDNEEIKLYNHKKNAQNPNVLYEHCDFHFEVRNDSVLYQALSVKGIFNFEEGFVLYKKTKYPNIIGGKPLFNSIEDYYRHVYKYFYNNIDYFFTVDLDTVDPKKNDDNTAFLKRFDENFVENSDPHQLRNLIKAERQEIINDFLNKKTLTFQSLLQSCNNNVIFAVCLLEYLKKNEKKLKKNLEEHQSQGGSQPQQLHSNQNGNIQNDTQDSGGLNNNQGGQSQGNQSQSNLNASDQNSQQNNSSIFDSVLNYTRPNVNNRPQQGQDDDPNHKEIQDPQGVLQLSDKEKIEIFKELFESYSKGAVALSNNKNFLYLENEFFIDFISKNVDQIKNTCNNVYDVRCWLKDCTASDCKNAQCKQTKLSDFFNNLKGTNQKKKLKEKYQQLMDLYQDPKQK